MRKRSERGKHIAVCDKLFREVVLKTRGSRCEWCGKETQVFISHVLPKGAYPRLRFVQLNVLLLCWRCHMERWHKNPLEAHEWLEKRSPGLLDELRALNVAMPKLDIKMTELLLKQQL